MSALTLSVIPISSKCHIELEAFREGVNGCLENDTFCNHDRHCFSYSLWYVE